jgi:hypothetical protein
LLVSEPLLFPGKGQLWSIAVTILQPRLKIQLNTLLFAKTLVRKDTASSSGSADNGSPPNAANGTKKNDDDDFSSKAQVMTLMTTDVDRVSEMAIHCFSLVGKKYGTNFLSHDTLIYCADSPIEVIIGSLFLYNLLGVPDSLIFPDSTLMRL